MKRKIFSKILWSVFLVGLTFAGVVRSVNAQQIATSPVTNTDSTTDSAASTTPNQTSPPAQQQSNALANPLPLSSSNWTASEVDGNFAETGTSGQQKIAMVLPKNSQHFELFLTGFQSNIPTGSTVAFSVIFDNGKSMSFSSQSDGTNLQANLNDTDLLEI